MYAVGIDLKFNIQCVFGCEDQKVGLGATRYIEMEMIYEDEHTVQWTGACTGCGRELHLAYEKGEQDERDDSGGRKPLEVC